jgi:uncharacterized protein YqeY
MDAVDGSAAQAGLRTALADAQRRRDQVAMSALRSALSAIGDAGRPSLTAADVGRIIRAEIGERLGAADAYDLGGQPGPARRLRAEADVLRRLDG